MNPLTHAGSGDAAGSCTDLCRGLDAAAAASRLAQDGPNVLPGSTPKSFRAILASIVREPMFLMLLVAGGIYLLLGDRAEALFLLAFVGVVIGITVAQEHKTQRTLESLRDLSAPRALVIRDGRELRIPGRAVVRGDVLVLHEGDRIPADALLRQGQLSVDESLLTGEPVAARKSASAAGNVEFGRPGGENTPFLYASTVITKGVGIAVVQAVGAASAVGRIGQALAATAEPDSALQLSSRALIRALTALALALATALVLLNWLHNERPLLPSLLSGIALAMATLPEEIPVILTVFLALGAWRIARIKVLTRHVPAVEALGAITVLAVDKTGTLTQNHMQVAELAAEGESFHDAAGRDLPEQFHALVEFAMLATPADPFDPMEKAIQAFGHDRLAGTEHIHDDRNPEFEYDLSPDILAMTRVFSSSEPARYLLATKGAPEAVADLCHLPAAACATIQEQVHAMAERGLRVLGVAQGEWRGDTPPHSQHDFDFSFLGLIGFLDPPRPEVPAAIAECRAAGIRVLMLTGDHPATARAVARQVGLSERPAVIIGAEIDALDDASLRARVRQADLCARLQPEQKLRLVRVLQQAGEVVAMTGDGVNDAPALKAADVGIAMGERGTDVAREAAALVLLDDSFASIVAAVRQGRRIYDNIAKATRFIFAAHVPIIALVLIPALLPWPTLLLPVHIVLLQLLIDPACSVAFEAEPADAAIMKRPPRPLGTSPFALRKIGAALAQGCGLSAILLAGYAAMQAAGWPPAMARGSVFVALIISLFLLILANRDPARATLANLRMDNPWLPRMLAAVGLVLAAAVWLPALRRIMDFARPDVTMLLAALGLIVAGGLWLELLRRTGRNLGQRTGRCI